MDKAIASEEMIEQERAPEEIGRRADGHEMADPNGLGDAAVQLGAAMRYYRVANGVSLRTMARRLGFSGHSNLADYELGRRLPCREIVASYEDTLQVPAGQLNEIHDRALAERAERAISELRSADKIDESADECADECADDPESDRPGDVATRIRLQVQLARPTDHIDLTVRLACDERRPRR